MNRLLIVLVTLFVFSLSAIAQESKIGIEFGPSYTSLRGNSNTDKDDSAIGFSVGARYQYPLTEILSIRTGIIYERKGSKSDITAVDEEGKPVNSVSFDNKFHYMIVPLDVKAKFSSTSNLYATAGIFTGYLYKAEMVPESDKFKKKSLTGDSERLDYGASVGLGIERSINDNLKLSLEAKYNLGLADISKISTVKTTSINFMMGIAYVLPF